MRQALRLARRAYGLTSPNPMVGAVLVKQGCIIGRGWHHRAGAPHAEIEALRDAERNSCSPKGATLYVTLEPCSTRGRTPPCTSALVQARIRRVVAAAEDPNPLHRGRGFRLLRRSGIRVDSGLLAETAMQLNEPFNHWIVHQTPFVTVKAAMTLDGRIATATGESKWITGPESRNHAMNLREGADAILVGVNTILADDPQLSFRPRAASAAQRLQTASGIQSKRLRRIVLDSRARTPLNARVVTDDLASTTTIVVTGKAPRNRVAALSKRVPVVKAPADNGRVDLPWLLTHLGRKGVTSLLVEGGGEVNASFLLAGLAHRVAFFYAPKLLGSRTALSAVAGEGIRSLADRILLKDVVWRRLGSDWLMTARL